jgi:hypothetical protein
MTPLLTVYYNTKSAGVQIMPMNAALLEFA